MLKGTQRHSEAGTHDYGLKEVRKGAVCYLRRQVKASAAGTEDIKTEKKQGSPANPDCRAFSKRKEGTIMSWQRNDITGLKFLLTRSTMKRQYGPRRKVKGIGGKCTTQ